MSALKEQLDLRRRERFNASKQPATVLPVLKLIDLDLTHTIPKKNQSIWSGVLPHIWVSDPHAKFIGVKKAQSEELRRQRRARAKSIATTTTSRSSVNYKRSQELTLQPRQRRVSFIPALMDGGSLTPGGRSSLQSTDAAEGSPISMAGGGSSSNGGPTAEPRRISKWLQVKTVVNVPFCFGL